MLDRNTMTLSPSIDADQIAQIAKALAHPARVRIIAFLLSKPGCIGGDIVEAVELAQSTVSEHLRILKDAGIVQGTIDYPRICYSPDPIALMPIRDLIEAIAARQPVGEVPCCYTPESCVPKETARRPPLQFTTPRCAAPPASAAQTSIRSSSIWPPIWTG